MPGLYIHIPFCTRKCAYCDFYSSTDLSLRDRLAEALRREMRDRRDYLGAAILDTLYVGGGTPSLMPAAALRGLIDTARDIWGFSDRPEITLEANPDDLSADYAAALATTGVNRLSIGIQSFIDRDLRFMGRRHDAAAAVEAVRTVRSAGFDNISIDLIYGIPGVSESEWKHNLTVASQLGVEHISAYCLTIEEGTPLVRRMQAGEFTLPPDAEIETQYAMLREELAAAGFEHYEVSNFALPGRRSRHNSAYWSGEPYLGIGPSAHSFDGATRSWSAASLGDYLSGARLTTERLSDSDRYNEYLMTRLRTSDGLDVTELTSRFGDAKAPEFLRHAERLLASGNLVRTGSRYRIPADRFLLSDGIIRDLFEV